MSVATSANLKFRIVRKSAQKWLRDARTLAPMQNLTGSKEPNVTDLDRALAYVNYARADRRKAEAALRAAQAEEQRQIEIFAKLVGVQP